MRSNRFFPDPVRRRPPRLMWVSLHVVGIGLLVLCDGWPTSGVLSFVLPCSIVLTVLLYAGASFRNPGYAKLPSHEGRQLLLKQTLLQLPFCAHCSAELQARTKHCHDCGRCVNRMDHHCWWLGNCVGKRTHCNFLAFLISETTLLTLTLCLSLDAAGAAAHRHQLLKLLCAIICGIICLIPNLATTTLLVFQLVLLWRGETTWERLRREQLNAAAQLPPDERPYDRGPLRNCMIFCGCEKVSQALTPDPSSSSPSPGELINCRAMLYIVPPFLWSTPARSALCPKSLGG